MIRIAFILFGAIRSGVETTFWVIKETLAGAFYLLHDSPARRQDFVTSSNKYPLFLCATRCDESKEVADRLQEIWINMQDIIKFWNKFSKYKQPSCKSFDNVKKAVTDPLSEAKICFSFICFLVEPSFKKFQADKSMVSFIYTELKSLLKTLPSTL